METLVLYALCTASLFYLGSRARITSFVWMWYPPKVSTFMDCSACSGTWYGALVGYVGGFHLKLAFLGMPGDRPETVAAVGLCSMAFTPIVAGYVQRAFDTLGLVDPPEMPYDPVGEGEPLPPTEPVVPVAEPTAANDARQLARARELREVSGTIETLAVKDRSGAVLGTITIPALPTKGDGESGAR